MGPPSVSRENIMTQRASRIARLVGVPGEEPAEIAEYKRRMFPGAIDYEASLWFAATSLAIPGRRPRMPIWSQEAHTHHLMHAESSPLNLMARIRAREAESNNAVPPRLQAALNAHNPRLVQTEPLTSPSAPSPNDPRAGRVGRRRVLQNFDDEPSAEERIAKEARAKATKKQEKKLAKLARKQRRRRR